MTVQTTELAPQSVDDARRKNFMAALSAAEQIVSETNALPTDFRVESLRWAPFTPELRFYFHRDIPGLRLFRDEQMLTETSETREDGSVYIEAVREDDDGLRVVAWTLFPAETSAVSV